MGEGKGGGQGSMRKREMEMEIRKNIVTDTSMHRETR